MKEREVNERKPETKQNKTNNNAATTGRYRAHLTSSRIITRNSKVKVLKTNNETNNNNNNNTYLINTINI